MAVRLITKEKTDSKFPLWKVVVEETNDGVDVKVESDNDSWVLFKIKSDGTFYRYEDIDATSGFKVDKNGRITESNTE
jgi:hypothetical protein